MNVIIVYATKHGSTQGVAGAVADALRERGAQVTLRPARAVRTGRRIRLGRARRGAVHRALGKHRWLSPAAVTVFGGVDPPGRRNHPQRDLRNWQTIRVWAAQACRRRSFARSRRRPTPAATGAGGTACRLEPSATLAKAAAAVSPRPTCDSGGRGFDGACIDRLISRRSNSGVCTRHRRRRGPRVR